MDNKEYYEEDGYKEYEAKYIKSKWFFPVIIVLFILIIATVIIRIFVIPNGSIKSLSVQPIKKMYVGETINVSAEVKGRGSLRNTSFHFDTSSDKIAEVSSKAGIIGKKVTNKITAKEIGSFTLTTYAKINDVKTLPHNQEIAVCNRLNAKVLQSDNLTVFYSSGHTTKANIYLGEADVCYDDITYEIEDTKIATVDENGIVTPKWLGNTNLIIKQDNNEIKVQINCVAYDEPVTGIEVKEKNIELKVGQSHKIEAQVLPENAINKGVIWESSDNEIVEVSNKGIITAKKIGIVTITVTTEEKQFSQKIKVTVK